MVSARESFEAGVGAELRELASYLFGLIVRSHTEAAGLRPDQERLFRLDVSLSMEEGDEEPPCFENVASWAVEAPLYEMPSSDFHILRIDRDRLLTAVFQAYESAVNELVAIRDTHKTQAEVIDRIQERYAKLAPSYYGKRADGSDSDETR